MGLFDKFRKKTKTINKQDKKEEKFERAFESKLHTTLSQIQKEPNTLNTLRNDYAEKIRLINAIKAQEEKYKQSHTTFESLKVGLSNKLNGLRGTTTKLLAHASKGGGVSNANILLENLKAQQRRAELLLKQEILANRNEVDLFKQLTKTIDAQVARIKNYLHDVETQHNLARQEEMEKNNEITREKDMLRRLQEEEGMMQELKYVETGRKIDKVE